MIAMMYILLYHDVGVIVMVTSDMSQELYLHTPHNYILHKIVTYTSS